MHKLVVNPDTAAAWEIPLQPGAIRLGRGPENDVSIEHPSIAPSHCEVMVRDSMVSLKDLGSSAGTLVDGIAINEIRLKPGQKFRLGDIDFRLQAESPLPEPAPASPQHPESCAVHPKASGRYRCPQCNHHFCDLCVSRRSARNTIAAFCRRCSVECDVIGTTSAPTPVLETPSMWRVLGGAFQYPLNGDGLILLVAGAVFFAAMYWLANRAALVGFFMMAFGAGYLISYYQAILVTSGTGENKMPDWPDFSDLPSLLWPVVQFLATFLFSFGPAILLRTFVPEAEPWRPWAVGAAVAWGCIYLPMSFAAVSMADSLSALNPLAIIPSILNVAGWYVVVVLQVGALIALKTVSDLFVNKLAVVPILPSLVSEFLDIYLSVVIMRTLGLLHWHNRDRLRWFTR